MLLNEFNPTPTPPKPPYTIRRNPQNTILTITSFIHARNSSFITCPETNNTLVSIIDLSGMSHSHAFFEKSKNLDINSFTKFRDDYGSYMSTTYNNGCGFIKINYDPDLLNYFSLDINTALITTPSNYIKYLKVLSEIPYLTLREGVCVTSFIDSTPQYVLGMHPSSYEREPYMSGYGVPQYPYIHIIQEDHTYFLKFEFISKLYDHETKINELMQLWTTDIDIISEFRQLWKDNPYEAVKAQFYTTLKADLSTTFFHDFGIQELSMEVTECGIVSIFFVFNLDNLYDDYDFLRNIPFHFH